MYLYAINYFYVASLDFMYSFESMFLFLKVYSNKKVTLFFSKVVIDHNVEKQVHHISTKKSQ